MKTQILLDQEPHAHGGQVVRALLKIEGDAPSSKNRTPLNISIVLDRSGSMDGPKLHAAREAAALLVQRLAPEDVVSVVAYDDEVTTVAQPSTANADGVSSAIRQIHAGGSTNLSGGWLKGRDYVSRNVKPEVANRVVLLTDGQANAGIIDPDRLTALCAQANEHGIRTTTIGFGADFNEHLLDRMAQAGGGNMHYIEHADQAPAVFAEEIEGLLSLAAQNLTLSIVPAEGAQAVAVHHSYPRQEIDGGLRLELGDLYAREPKLVLIEFLVLTPLIGDVQIAKLVLEATVLNENGSVEMQEVSMPITTSFDHGPVTNPEVRREQLLLEAAQVRAEVLGDQQRGDYDAARTKMQRMAEKLRSAGIEDEQFVEESADLLLMADQMAPATFGAAEAKYMYIRSRESNQARRTKNDAISRVKRQKRSD